MIFYYVYRSLVFSLIYIYIPWVPFAQHPPVMTLTCLSPKEGVDL